MAQRDITDRAFNGHSPFGLVDHAARFQYGDQVGFGLHEHGFFGAFEHYGMNDGASGAR